ncbi:uncharacterized protein G2W53_007905 [Senna tora]|uniref:Uncharacterized protein n=1 Tax=Senna tora TaxID=362788 RepID=A0A834X662_9FABA|nr:uncharacterized protein G2W53_007905 [Senna tora]
MKFVYQGNWVRMDFMAELEALRLVLPPRFVPEYRLTMSQTGWADRVGPALPLMVRSKIAISSCGSGSNTGGGYICHGCRYSCSYLSLSMLVCTFELLGSKGIDALPALVTVMVPMPVVTVSTPIVAVSTPVTAGRRPLAIAVLYLESKKDKNKKTKNGDVAPLKAVPLS